MIRKGISRRSLLALLLQPRHVVSPPALMEILWGDELPQDPASASQIQVSYLRRTLAAGSVDGSQPIRTQAGGYAVDVDPDQVDVHRFERLTTAIPPVDALRNHATVTASLDLVEEALGLWRGDALADVIGEPFVTGTVTRLDEMRWRSRRWTQTPREASRRNGAHRHEDRKIGALEWGENRPLFAHTQWRLLPVHGKGLVSGKDDWLRAQTSDRSRRCAIWSGLRALKCRYALQRCGFRVG